VCRTESYQGVHIRQDAWCWADDNRYTRRCTSSTWTAWTQTWPPTVPQSSLPVAATVRLTSDITIPPGAVWSIVNPWHSAVSNPGAANSPYWDGASALFARETGLYQVSCTIKCRDAGYFPYGAAIQFRKSENTILDTVLGGGSTMSASPSIVTPMSAGQYVQVYLYNDASSNNLYTWTLGETPSFSLIRVG